MEATPPSFPIPHYARDRLMCVEGINAPLDHMAGRKLLASGKSPSPEIACVAVAVMHKLSTMLNAIAKSGRHWNDSLHQA